MARDDPRRAEPLRRNVGAQHARLSELTERNRKAPLSVEEDAEMSLLAYRAAERARAARYQLAEARARLRAAQQQLRNDTRALGWARRKVAMLTQRISRNKAARPALRARVRRLRTEAEIVR